MDFFKDQIKKATDEKPPQEHQQGGKPPSSSELLSSAKLVADAAQSAARNETDKLDKGKVAGAGADLLGAASHYGKLDDKSGVGQYVDKAENYLRQYESSNTTASPDAAKGGSDAAPPPPKDAKPSSDGGEHAESGGGLGGYMKMAEGFLKK